MLTADLDHVTARAVVALANRAPSVHNSQPWRWRISPTRIHLFADESRTLPATDPYRRDLRLSCGAALHHLRVALLAAGLGTSVRRLPDPADPAHLASVATRPAQPTPADLALVRAIEHRQSDRRMLSTWPVPTALLDVLTRAADEQDALLLVLDRESDRRAVARLVEHAAIEQELTPTLSQETARWTGRSRGAREGVPAANVPVAPAGTVPVRHVAAAEQDQTVLGREESDGTLLAMIATPTDEPVDQLRAGEALSAVLLAATHIGLATDPISQPLEVPATRAALRASLLVGEAEPQLLVRLGWAAIGAPPMPRTGRRPVTDTIEWLDVPGS